MLSGYHGTSEMAYHVKHVNSLANRVTKMISHVVVVIDLYFASTENLEIMLCFLDLQGTRAFPKKTQ